jgi:hypothetical protein
MPQPKTPGTHTEKMIIIYRQTDGHGTTATDGQTDRDAGQLAERALHRNRLLLVPAVDEAIQAQRPRRLAVNERTVLHAAHHRRRQLVAILEHLPVSQSVSQSVQQLVTVLKHL